MQDLSFQESSISGELAPLSGSNFNSPNLLTLGQHDQAQSKKFYEGPHELQQNFESHLSTGSGRKNQVISTAPHF